MSTQTESVARRVEYIGAGTCDVCQRQRADVLRFQAGLFADGTVCDTCLALMLRGFNAAVGGDAQPQEDPAHDEG